LNTKRQMLFVGAPPPPFHGQAVITGIVFKTKFFGIAPTFYEARFSEEISNVGGFSLKKVWVLLHAWVTILSYALGNKRAELYYCAGSANTVPFLKDVILLGTVGKLFKKRYIHYHSGGLPTWLEEKGWRAKLGKWSYQSGANTSIACSRYVEVPVGDDGLEELPNGLEVPEPKDSKESEQFTFLFVGALRESKGLKCLLEAGEKLDQQGREFKVKVVGEWSSDMEKERCLSVVCKEYLQRRVEFSGRLTGDDKWDAFATAEAFVFPSFYESENMPLVVIEALGSGVPVISTNWRSIPKLIDDGKTGFLVEPKDVDGVTEKMAWLLDNLSKALEMGETARAQYEMKYSELAFQARLREILGDVD